MADHKITLCSYRIKKVILQMTKVTVFGSGTKVLLVVFVASGYAHECD